MHLSLIISFSPSPHTLGQWRLARSFRGYDYRKPEYWEHIARTLERGKFDLLFFSDSFALHDRYGGSSDTTIRRAVQCPRLDPLTLLPLVARVTKHLGIAATVSTTFLPPFWLARHFASLDHLTDGRVAWNVVTSFSQSEARNFGLENLPEHDERYDRADEYLEICNALWNSWEPDAVIFDREEGIFADPAKVHPINYEGRYYRSEGPLHVPRSPQERPVIIQAGSSPRGLAFAARHAEVHFALPRTTEDFIKHRESINAALAKAGRTPDSIKVLWGVLPIVGETESDARDKQREINECVDVEAAKVMLSGHLDYDLSTWPEDRPLKELDVPGIQGHARFSDYSLAELAERMELGLGTPITGTAEQVADQLEALYESGGGDGFMLVTHALPSSIDDFVDLVVPELQSRGVFRQEYGETMLRERFFPAAGG